MEKSFFKLDLKAMEKPMDLIRARESELGMQKDLSIDLFASIAPKFGHPQQVLDRAKRFYKGPSFITIRSSTPTPAGRMMN
jgi:hypothetical protein